MEENDLRVLEIDTKEFKNNVFKIQTYCGNNIRVMPVIKANAYGTYINKKMELIKDFNIVGVANVEEGTSLRKIGFKNEILILNQPYENEIRKIIDNDLTIGISSMEFLEKINATDDNIKVHLEIETGMGRTGIFYDDLANFIKSASDNIKIEGIYTHFSSADSDFEYTEKQIEIFENSIRLAESILGNIKYKHAAASNGIINFKNSYFNTVRPGIVLYGYKSLDDMYKVIDLKPIAKLKSRITYIKEVETGFSISYSRKFITKRKSRIATIPIGYADGIRREMSNNGEVVINGKKAPIVGTVCMDSIMVDITNISDVNVGDYVYIWDNENITLEDVAEKCNTINYEIISTISNRVTRKFI